MEFTFCTAYGVSWISGYFTNRTIMQEIHVLISSFTLSPMFMELSPGMVWQLSCVASRISCLQTIPPQSAEMH
jgi:hypothetical protein